MNQPRRFLILGASGFLGRHLYSLLGPARAVATYHSHPIERGVQFDAGRGRVRDTLLRDGHEITTAFVLHGVTSIDACARNPDLTWHVNVDGMMQAIDDLMEAGIKPIYASSDAVFDGTRGGWTEDDLPNPSLTYGKQKAAVEQYLESKAAPWVIARLSKVVGSDADAKNLLGEWVRQLDAEETIRCATDLVFTPAHVDDVAKALIRLADEPHRGIYNVCGPGSMSRIELLQLLIAQIRRHRNLSPSVVACSIRDFPFLEPRPLDNSMLPTKLYGVLGYSFRDMRSVCSELALNRYGKPNRAGRSN